MNVTPDVRRALHNAVDIILDALAEEEGRPKRRRGRADDAAPPLPPGTTAEDIERIDARLRRAGFRKRS